jgi:hypothetical protein
LFEEPQVLTATPAIMTMSAPTPITIPAVTPAEDPDDLDEVDVDCA